MAETPVLFRIILQVSNLDQAEEFYGKLLGDRGRRIPYASRHYIDTGPLILALVDPSIDGEQAKPLPDYIYFSVSNLEEIHARATELGLSRRRRRAWGCVRRHRRQAVGRTLFLCSGSMG